VFFSGLNKKITRRYKRMPHGEKWFKAGKTVHVDDLMQKGYSYKLTYDCGTNLQKGGLDENGKLIRYPGFRPAFTPREMLEMGIFEGKYITDCRAEFPREWFKNAKMVKTGEPADESLNFFGTKSRQSLQIWREKGWIAFKRHYAQVKKNAKGDLTKYRRARQGLLQWGHDCFV
jgi:hypothetical protein